MPDYSALYGRMAGDARAAARASASPCASGPRSSRAGRGGSRRPRSCRSRGRGDECRARWERGVPLLAEARPVIAPASVEDLLGPVMERLAADGPEAVVAFRRFAAGLGRGPGRRDRAVAGAGPRPGAAWLLERVGLAAHLGAFLAGGRACAPRSRSSSRACAPCRTGWDRGAARGAGALPATATCWRTAGGGSPAISAAARGSRRGCAALLRELELARPGAPGGGGRSRRATSSRPAGVPGLREGVDRRERWNAARRSWRTGARRTSTTTPRAKATGAHALARAPAAARDRSRRVNAVLFDVALTAYIVAAAAAAGLALRAAGGARALRAPADPAGWVCHTGGDHPARGGAPARCRC